jgi:hypothetical protein
MQNESITCPKCNYTRTEDDQYVMEGICPECGIAYNKWRSGTHNVPSSPANSPIRIIEEGDPEIALFESTWARFLGILLYIPDKVDNPTFWGRCIAYLFFLVWGWRFMLNGMGWEAIGGSFMHNVNLPFHEFGHVFFRPFGQFMTILGGSLFQVLLPLCLALAFLVQQHNPFAASIMLWWCGQSFIDLSPYIADATYRGLPLVSGMGEESHDWGNLLTMLGWLHYDQRMAKISFTIGSCLLVISMVWGAYLLNKQRKVLSDY